MSREIKFRAWHEQDKEMVYFKNERLVNDQYQMQHLAHLINGDYGDVLMQFTGLKDINGVDIYDGDIIKSFHFNDRDNAPHYLYFKVKWSERFNGWVVVRSDGTELQSWVYCNSVDGCFYVIGNIYEKPNLINP